MTYKEFYKPLTAIYPEGEARWIARLVFETKYSLSREALMMGEEQNIDEDELSLLRQQLLAGCPVQYVLGVAEFCGRQFRVGLGVLVPRPETEELCRWIVSEAGLCRSPRILDIGTGSGCIACSLAADIPTAEVTAWDVSEDALRVARGNAVLNDVRVMFQLVDILSVPRTSACSRWDVIVSNPPYICCREKAQMAANVLDYEPPSALFVPDEDPLLFYRAIAGYALATLAEGGLLFFELNALYARETASLLAAVGMGGITIKKDQYGKERFIRACKQTTK